MALRLSFTLDTDLAGRLDTFAKKQELDRNEALLLLLESGLTQAEQSGVIPPVHDRDFKEAARMQKNIEQLTGTIDDLKKEVRALHHLMNLNVGYGEKKPVKRGFFR